MYVLAKINLPISVEMITSCYFST